jgi:hypothetical protein
MSRIIQIPTAEEILELADECEKNEDGFWDMLPVWWALARVGRARDAQKRDFGTDQNWKEDASHLIGVVSETVIWLETGLAPDYSLKVQGDGGVDFEFDGVVYDVKGATNMEDPHLKELILQNRHPDVYLLVHVPTEGKVPMYTGRLVGWATTQQLCHASCDIHEWEGEPRTRDYGKGDRYYFTERNLSQLGTGQLGLPSGLTVRELA